MVMCFDFYPEEGGLLSSEYTQICVYNSLADLHTKFSGTCLRSVWIPVSVPYYCCLLTAVCIYSQTRLIRTLLIRHFRLIRRGNLKTLKPLPLTPMLNQPFN